MVEQYRARLEKDEESGRWGVILITNKGLMPIVEDFGEPRLKTYPCKSLAKYEMNTLIYNLNQSEDKEKLMSYNNVRALRCDQFGKGNQVFNMERKDN